VKGSEIVVVLRKHTATVHIRCTRAYTLRGADDNNYIDKPALHNIQHVYCACFVIENHSFVFFMGVDPVAKIPDLLLLSIPIVWFTPELFEYVTRKCRQPSTIEPSLRQFATFRAKKGCIYGLRTIQVLVQEKGGY